MVHKLDVYGHNIFPRTDGHRFAPGEPVIHGDADYIYAEPSRVCRDEGDHVLLFIYNSTNVSSVWPDSITLPFGEQDLVGRDIILRGGTAAKVVAQFGKKIMVSWESTWRDLDMLVERRDISAVL